MPITGQSHTRPMSVPIAEALERVSELGRQKSRRIFEQLFLPGPGFPQSLGNTL